jgi:hypothetical protein
MTAAANIAARPNDTADFKLAAARLHPDKIHHFPKSTTCLFRLP